MKNKLYILLAVLGGFSSCKNNDQFTIEGTIDNAGKVKKVMLYETDQLVDSAFLNENNEFKFQRSSPDGNFYTLTIGDNNFLLIAQNGEELEFKTNLADSTHAYEINGSDDSEKLLKFNEISNKYGKIYMQIQNEYEQRVNANPASKEEVLSELMPKFQENMDKFSKEALDFANDNKDNLAGFYAIGTIDQTQYEPELIQYAEDIKSKFPDNKAVKSFVERMESVKSVSVGHAAPNFTLPTPDGKQMQLNDFKGKYVLLDFWASWCAPCRQESPNLVRIYNKFKDKNFTILGVSLDKSKDAWLKAIKDDNLNWNHVSELKEWNGEVNATYKVEGIPASFVINPEGKIVAKNLTSNELEGFLNKTLR
ncbi:redoxin domain-containing protein [Rubrolithibacter danxiaensis]|uniref:redoxin domain-containing protein n=1 Tax=Rubrolithibacter danxiaensis TaxID=3390805 RepID=UPI003BF910AD